MAVSGLVTLLILVILEASVYATVSAAVEGSAQDQLKAAAGITETGSDDPYGFTVVGPRAGLIPILVDPQGNVGVGHGLPQRPPGLPDKASLAAVTGPNDVDMREITAPDGTPYRVISFFSGSQRYSNYKVQWAQNRTAELDLLNTLALVLLGGGLIALLASVLAGYLYAGRALVPVKASIERRQAALQRQREFTANASHELRTPLTVIRASVEDLRRNRRSRVDEVGEALDDIDAEVRHVTALVEDMLLLARTDSGVVQLERVPLDLANTASEAVSLLASLGVERGVAVTLDPLLAPISGDPLRLRQLVTILVDNAVRHSRTGSTVEVRVRPEPGAALLEVEDHGPGIKPEDLPRLWERFWRADDAPAGGTGLGLAIAKWIVDQHGGTIGANNREEGGARFWVRLPAFVGPAAGEPASEGIPGSGPETVPPDDITWRPDEGGQPVS
ncbi:MAG: HAMP domain-containing sensor histidine kinase [Candidatus Limnocylindrales bacterium]|jgi:signal transduction histidine kinase